MQWQSRRTPMEIRKSAFVPFFITIIGNNAADKIKRFFLQSAHKILNIRLRAVI